MVCGNNALILREKYRGYSNMKVAILGGGITGLTAAYYLSKKGHKITLFEKEAGLGGLAAGFKKNTWQWYLDKTYHHIFLNDQEILTLAREIGFGNFIFQISKTASLFKKNTIYPLDTAKDLLFLPYLSVFDKLLTGITLARLKYLPFFARYEQETAADFLRRNMGKKSWQVLWQELFRKKFGKYAENILTPFFWARIVKRTKKLGYPSGGFQSFVNALEQACLNFGVKICKNQPIIKIEKNNQGELRILKQRFDRVISTLATPLTSQVASMILPSQYLRCLHKINYLHAVTLILIGQTKLLNKVYWLNNLVKKNPFTVVVQHTNLINKKYYSNQEILYIGTYLEEKNSIWRMNKEELVNYYADFLRDINANFKANICQSFLFKHYFAQPVYDKNFINYRPSIITPEKNFYLANLDLTYPYDRGTNYAVKLGKQVAEIFH